MRLNLSVASVMDLVFSDLIYKTDQVLCGRHAKKKKKKEEDDDKVQVHDRCVLMLDRKRKNREEREEVTKIKIMLSRRLKINK